MRAAAIVRPRMQISPRGGHAAMIEAGLHQVNRDTANEGVRGVRMRQYLCRYGGQQTGPCCGGLHDTMYLGGIQRAALRGAEYRPAARPRLGTAAATAISRPDLRISELCSLCWRDLQARAK